MSRAGGSSTRAPRMAWSRRSSTIATSRRAIWARGGSCADEGARRSRAAGARSRGTVLRAAGPLGAAPPGNRRERARLAGPARRRPAAGRGGQAPDRARSQSHPRRVSGKAPRRRCQRAGLRARRRARGGGSARADRFHRYGARARFAGGGGDAARPPASAHLPAARRHAHALRAWRRLGQRHRRLGRRRTLRPRSAGRDRAVRGGRADAGHRRARARRAPRGARGMAPGSRAAAQRGADRFPARRAAGAKARRRRRGHADRLRHAPDHDPAILTAALRGLAGQGGGGARGTAGPGRAGRRRQSDLGARRRRRGPGCPRGAGSAPQGRARRACPDRLPRAIHRSACAAGVAGGALAAASGLRQRDRARARAERDRNAHPRRTADSRGRSGRAGRRDRPPDGARCDRRPRRRVCRICRDARPVGGRRRGVAPDLVWPRSGAVAWAMVGAMRLEIAEEVAIALRERRPVVALETSVVAQGLPPPANLEAARRCAAAVRAEGAAPAAVAVIEGRLVVGASEAQLERIADPSRKPAKAGSRDLAAVCARGLDAGTTVSATCAVAERAGIRVFATGGIGGVHRRVAPDEPSDVSSDPAEIARRRVCLVCAGPKVILDLPATAELLETLAVPVWGYRTSELPAFFTDGSGIALEHRFEDPERIAAALHAHWDILGSHSGVVVAVPPPSPVPRDEVEAALAGGLREAARRRLPGKEVTPFLLAALAEATSDRTRAANLGLLENNARIAAGIARELLQSDTAR